MRKVMLKSLHQIENISKSLVKTTFSFSLWILVSNLMFDDALISKNENVSLRKMFTKQILSLENHQPVVLLKFVMYKILFSKCRYDWHIHEMYN